MTDVDPIPTPAKGDTSHEPTGKPVPGLFAGKVYNNRYELVDRIAIGGMGEVWKARDKKDNKLVAIKILRPEYAGEEQFLSRLRVEASNAQRINHPNLAQVYDSGEEDGLGWIVMELVDGKPLTKMLQQRRILPLDVLLPILRQTAEALSAVHAAGVVHRDIKPGNILITSDNKVKLTDFGISRSQNQVTLTAAGMVMGTAQYLPPEQAIGQLATPSGDLYALGVVAYEALVGKRPFTGESQVDIAFAHVNSPVPVMPSHIPAPLRDLVMKLLDKKPSNRPATAAKLAYLISELEVELLGSSPYRKEEKAPTPITSLDGGTVPAPYQMPRYVEVDPHEVARRRRQCFGTTWATPQALPDATGAGGATDIPGAVDAPAGTAIPGATNAPGVSDVPGIADVKPHHQRQQAEHVAPAAPERPNVDYSWIPTGKDHPNATGAYKVAIVNSALPPAPRHSRGTKPEERALAWMVVVGVTVFVTILLILFHFLHMSSLSAGAYHDFLSVIHIFSVADIKEALYV